MDKRKLGSCWVLIAGIWIAVLGLIHCSATPVIFRAGFADLPRADGLVFIYMFVAMGAAMIFVGLLTVYCSFGLRRSEGWARTVAMGAAVFVALAGVGAVASMADNPFAYITLGTALATIAPLLIYRQAFEAGTA
jgi:hypothetical protein